MNRKKSSWTKKNADQIANKIIPGDTKGFFSHFIKDILSFSDVERSILLPAILEAIKALNEGREINCLEEVFNQAPNPLPLIGTSCLSKKQKGKVLGILRCYYTTRREEISNFASVALN